ncbi:60S ribosomal protein L26, putative [Leishmania tarentolae]|uniref:60S ribosomal protein L26, putative n=1 Tax=Leishmania tarentolae TaxID=5689 RepID=A0A640KT19_LEITA|nr:60S ribosomal protein L26, putative [Leishmania tarentolae]
MINDNSVPVTDTQESEVMHTCARVQRTTLVFHTPPIALDKMWLVHLLHGLVRGADLALALVGLGRAVLALQDGLAVVRQLQLRDLDVGGMDADGHSGAVCLLAVHLIDEDDPLEAVARRHLTLTALEGPALHDDLVVLAHGHGTHVVLGAQLLGERGAHQHTAHMAWGLKMRAAGLAAGTTLDARHLIRGETLQ